MAHHRCTLLLASLHVARFPLAAHAQHEDGIDFGDVAVQGKVSVGAAADDEFAFAVCGGAADQRVALQYIQRFDDFVDAPFGVLDLMAGEVFENAFEILGDLGCQLDARHGQRASLRATGCLAGFPATRFCR